jgi:uncharacterized lipoprotein YddW (UPF0748 family)
MRFLNILILLTVLMQIATASAVPKLSEARGLWVVRNALETTEQIDAMMAFAHKYGFTDLFVQIRGRGDAYYNSSYEPKAADVFDSRFDPLAYLLLHPYADSMRIHVWMNVFYIWSKDTLPADRSHIVNRQSDWLARPLDQSNISMVLNYPNSARKAGVEGLYLSPSLPKVQNYFIDVVKDVLGKYDVDGVHLDYVRYPDSKFDLNPDVVARYRQRYSINPRLFLANPEGFVKQFGLSDYQHFYANWRRYLRDGLSDFIRRFSGEIRQEKSNIIITAAVKPDIPIAHWEYYQDWDRWLEEGWLDYAVPMNYAPDDETFLKRLKTYTDKLPAGKFLTGISLYNQPERDAIQKMERVSSLHNAGFVLFSYQQLKNQKFLQSYLLKQNHKKNISKK